MYESTENRHDEQENIAFLRRCRRRLVRSSSKSLCLLWSSRSIEYNDSVCSSVIWSESNESTECRSVKQGSETRTWVRPFVSFLFFFFALFDDIDHRGKETASAFLYPVHWQNLLSMEARGWSLHFNYPFVIVYLWLAMFFVERVSHFLFSWTICTESHEDSDLIQSSQSNSIDSVWEYSRGTTACNLYF